jgi:putative phosphoesterase
MDPAYPIGVISDTHGLLRPEALTALAGSAFIIHAGDVGDPVVLLRLRDIAPAVAVRGNVDRQPWAAGLPATRLVEVEGHAIYVLHDLAALDIDPAAANVAVVISGHTHRPRIEEKGGVLYLNPGSAGPRRFDLPTTVARLTLVDGRPHATLINLPIKR